MADASRTSFEDFLEQTRGMMAFNPMLAPQMEHFWRAQDGVLEEAEAFAQAWFRRRHEAARSALELARKMNGNGGDPSAALRGMMDWQQHSFERLAGDMQEWIELCSRCAGRMTAAEVDVAKEGTEEIAKRAKSGAKAKHSTPV